MQDESKQAVYLMRSMSKQYAMDLVEKGEIRFRTPHDWVERAKNEGEGRGDFFEGTIAFCDENDTKEADKIRKKYKDQGRPSLMEEIHEGKIYFKDERSMNLPCLCFYGIERKNENGPTSQDILPKFFEDFGEETTLCFLRDVGEFKRILQEYLKPLGVKEEEIIIAGNTYVDFSEAKKDFDQEFPNELWAKNKKFSYQSEVRLVINTENKNVLEKMKEPITLEPLKSIVDTIDVADICNGALVKVWPKH